MIKIENVETVGWEPAIRGMRNPLNSWSQGDSDWGMMSVDGYVNVPQPNQFFYHVGPTDKDLMMRLRNAGTDHRKFMRMILCYCDITAPLYWWKEFDTYRNGVEKNSCSTMHKIQAEEITPETFSFDHVKLCPVGKDFIEELEKLRLKFIATHDKKYWYALIQLLPSSYNQRRTCMISYEALANMYRARKNHKLDEWHTFCHWIETLPYSELITGDRNE